VLSATNRDLRNAIDKGSFREDLYFRLAQIRVFVPPLRQRLPGSGPRWRLAERASSR
jgi:transcriptional regulator with PAS, ATPase and Fis domain